MIFTARNSKASMAKPYMKYGHVAWNYRWAEARIKERRAEKERNLCRGAQDVPAMVYMRHNRRDGKLEVVEIRGTATFAPQLLIERNCQ